MSGNTLPEPTENDNIDCHLQQVGMGHLICKAAKQTGSNTTNKTNPGVCFNCPTGKIYREIGCDAALPEIRLTPYMGNDLSVDWRTIFCRIRKRETTLEYCQTCSLPTAETTRQIVTTARSLFETLGFYPSYQDIEKARLAIRDGNFDNAITRSITCLESTMKVCHEKLNQELPSDKGVTGLWKSTKALLDLEGVGTETDAAWTSTLGSLSGLISNLGNMRNALSDAHGKGLYSPAVSELIAELALNSASTLATTIIRRFKQLKDKES